MFTGLVEDVGEVVSRDNSGGSVRLSVRTGLPLAEVALGDSVAVDGACFTVVAKGPALLSVDVGPESLARTVAGAYAVGAPVNLERALQVGGRLGGHFVLGHVDGVGVLRDKRRRGDAWDLDVSAPREVLDLTVPKGSITVDGTSLTVNHVAGDAFRVSLIPHTQARTTLLHKAPGTKVNLESDVLARMVAWLLERRGVLAGGNAQGSPGGGVTQDLLRQAGFL
jgi:riboflavin synthase